MSTIVIKNLHATVADKPILKGLNLTINTGEVHALIGPNGHGKSTLLNVIMGHPKYEVTKGSIKLDGKEVLDMEVDERARAGLFLAMQAPQEVAGVTVSDFLRSAVNSKREKPVNLINYVMDLEKATKAVGFELDMVHRFINEGFSGGEKKRNELLQALMLKPKFAMLDEVDSGLDVDAMKNVANIVNSLIENKDFGALVVSHYPNMYRLVKPTHVHIIIDGKIIVTGGMEIVEKIDKFGFNWIKRELGIEIKKEVKRPQNLEVVAIKDGMKKQPIVIKTESKMKKAKAKPAPKKVVAKKAPAKKAKKKA
jgi:Fe-S cluster assembly ATP-binding protein